MRAKRCAQSAQVRVRAKGFTQDTRVRMRATSVAQSTRVKVRTKCVTQGHQCRLEQFNESMNACIQLASFTVLSLYDLYNS